MWGIPFFWGGRNFQKLPCTALNRSHIEKSFIPWRTSTPATNNECWICFITFKYSDINHSTIQQNSFIQAPESMVSLCTADLMIFSRWCTSHLRLMRLMCSSAMTCDHVPRHLGVMAGCLRRQRLQATNGYKVIKINMSCMNQHHYKPWTSDDPCFWAEKSHSFNNKET